VSELKEWGRRSVRWSNLPSAIIEATLDWSIGIKC
jgi:hypothetical protein